MFDWGSNEEGFDHGMIEDMNMRSIWCWDVRIIDVGGDAAYLRILISSTLKGGMLIALEDR